MNRHLSGGTGELELLAGVTSVNEPRMPRRAWRLAVLLQILLFAFAAAAPALVGANDYTPSGPPTITSDQADYAPGATVTLTGSNWYGGEVVDIAVDDNDGNAWSLNSDPDPVADAWGNFTYQFVLPPFFVTSYTVTATGALSGTATTSFTDLAIGTYDQCSNDDGDGYASGDLGCRWTNGNLQANNSTYFEGDATVQRVWLEDFVPGSSHTLTLVYGTTKGGEHAYDFLTTWSWSEDWITLADRCQAPTGTGLIAGCTTATETTFPMGDDANVPNSIEVGGQVFTIRGGTITNVTNPVLVDGAYGGGDSETAVTITFTVEANAATGPLCETAGADTCGIIIWFGAHIAESDPWIAVDGFGGATEIPGSPYHVSLDAVDGSSVGERDNQMQANAIREPANIIVIKQTNPDGSAQSFEFDTTYGANFNLTDGQQNDSGDIGAGIYDVVELTPAGWDLLSISCVSSIGDATDTDGLDLDLEDGETITCTFTNEQDAKIIVVKQTNPDGSPQSFEFDTTYGANFFLTDGQQNDSGDLAPGSYDVAEIVPAGWDLETINCVSSIGDAADTDGLALDLDAGEVITCTFTNEQDAKIIVIKQTNPDGAAQSFEFDTTYGANFFLTDGQQNDSGDLDPGSYDVDELTPAGWDQTSVSCVSSIGDATDTDGLGLDLDAGEVITCTFSNEQDAKIIVIKQTTPDGAVQSFEFDTTYGANFFLSDGQQNDSGDLDPGAYDVAEIVPAGWNLTSISCVSSIGDATDTDGLALDLDAGETITCTFNNTQDGRIIVIKQTNPDGSAQSFEFDTDYGANFFLTDGQQNDSGTLDPGTYDVAEIVPAGWDLISATCDDGSDPSSIGLAAGETVTCTFTNEQDAKIIVIKQTNPDGSTQSFEFDTTYGANFNLTDGQQNDSGDLDPGSYDVAEIVPAGWDLETINCVSSIGDAADTDGLALDLDAGEVITCTFTNEQDANIIVIKQTLPDGSTQLFDFETTYDDVLGADFQLADGDQDDSGDLDPGSYGVVETVPAGWDLESINCVSSIGDAADTDGLNLDLDAGETITCTFTNEQDATVNLLKLTDGLEDPALVWTFKLYTGPDGFDSGTLLATDTTPPSLLDFGGITLDPDETFTICEEGIPAAWTTNWLVDTDGDGIADTAVTPYNPNADDPVPEDLGNRCVDFGAGTTIPLVPGDTLVFQVDNVAPGGDARTPGYWKNWNRCTGGNQAAVAARNGGSAEGFWLLEDVLPQTIGDLLVDTCAEGVAVLDSRDLNSGKKIANDACYTLARALLAAKLNVSAGAAHSGDVDDAISEGQALLADINFDGSGACLGPKVKGAQATLRAKALSIAGYLDAYNNNLALPPYPGYYP